MIRGRKPCGRELGKPGSLEDGDGAVVGHHSKRWLAMLISSLALDMPIGITTGGDPQVAGGIIHGHKSATQIESYYPGC